MALYHLFDYQIFWKAAQEVWLLLNMKPDMDGGRMMM